MIDVIFTAYGNIWYQEIYDNLYCELKPYIVEAFDNDRYRLNIDYDELEDILDKYPNTIYIGDDECPFTYCHRVNS